MDTNNIKEMVDIVKVAADLGILPAQQSGSYYHGPRCPNINHPDAEDHRCFTVFSETQTAWCFCCEQGWDAGGLVETVKDLPFIGACNWLSETYGLPFIKFSGEDEAQAKERRGVFEVLTAAARYFNSQLPDDMRVHLQQHYGLNNATINSYLIGYAPANGLREHLRASGLDPEYIKKSGLFVKISSGWSPFFNQRIVFPYWKAGQATYFIGRQTKHTPDHPWELGKYKKLPTHSTKKEYISEYIRNDILLGEDSIRGKNVIFLAEGVTDSYAMLQAEYPTISPVTTRINNNQYRRMEYLLKSVNTVYMVPDAEENAEGLKGALDTSQRLQAMGVGSFIVELPRPEGIEKVDAADFFRDHDKADFDALVAAAKTGLQLTIDQLAAEGLDLIHLTARLGPVIEALANMPPGQAAGHVEYLKNKLGLKTDFIKGLLKEIKNATFNSNGDTSNEKEETQNAVLLKIAADLAYFHSPEGVAYAKLRVADHIEIMGVRGDGFKGFLSYEFFRKQQKSPSREALYSALSTIEAWATYDYPMDPVYVRSAELNGNIYIDLSNDAWQAVEISSAGWGVIDTCPVNFRRPKGMLALPTPDGHGDINLLRHLLNLQGEDDWILVVSHLIQTARPSGPYPILALHGEQGSAKSTAARLIKSTIDPSAVPLRPLPRKEHDLAIAANNNWLLVFDNLSFIRDWMSDALCRLSTGGGFATRELYKNADEILFNSTRPQILTGISDIITNHDLADRSIIITLDPIPDNSRLLEKELLENFRAIHPQVLAGLFDALSTALANVDGVHLDRHPRMADFAQWVVAAEPALNWPTGQFMRTYNENRKMVVEKSLESSALATSLQNLAEEEGSWEGTATELLEKLEDGLDDRVLRSKGWPSDVRYFGKVLRELSSFLRRSGVIIIFPDRNNKKRTIQITYEGEESDKDFFHHSQTTQKNDVTDVTDVTNDKNFNENNDMHGDIKGDMNDVDEDLMSPPNMEQNQADSVKGDMSDMSDIKKHASLSVGEKNKKPFRCEDCKGYQYQTKRCLGWAYYDPDGKLGYPRNQKAVDAQKVCPKMKEMNNGR